MFGLQEYDKAHNWLYQAQKTAKLMWFEGDTHCALKGLKYMRDKNKRGSKWV